MTMYKWSQTAASNGTADSTCPFPEGMAPSAINDGARGMMAAAAKYRDDVSGQITTSGTSTAYAVSSFQGFDSLADMHGKEVWFTPHTTNGATVTLNVDGLGVKPLRSAPGVELPAGVMIQGTPLGAIYNNTDGAWYLKGLFGNPYNIPLGAGLDFWGTTAPNSSFAFPFGQAISRTTYAALFALLSTTYGPGDGSTTFNLPDKRGRVSAAIDAMGGTAASRMSTATLSATGLGGAGGAETETLTAGQIPSITSQLTAALSVSVTSSNYVASNANDATSVNPGSSGGGGGTVSLASGFLVSKIASTGTASGTGSVASTNTGGQAHVNVQPTIACNYIIRIL